jgi:hypothetical protein
MNFYLIDTEDPSNRLRHYKNSRVANFTAAQLNAVAGTTKYTVIQDDTPVISVRVDQLEQVDHLAYRGVR